VGSGKSEGVRNEGGLAYWRVFFWVWVLGLVVRGEGGIRVLPGWFSGDFEFGDFDGCDGIVKFFSFNIDANVWRKLCVIDDGEVIGEF
jgi:hypothetical protein